ncbi:MAG: glycosyltransferase [Saprospiraceae bacterium]|nr:glycosyltransferase [Saprospiraceae bacterium]
MRWKKNKQRWSDEPNKLLGLRKDIPLLMSAADVLLFPSLWEGLGMVAVEAQAAGLKVVAADNLPDEAFIIKELEEKEHFIASCRLG